MDFKQLEMLSAVIEEGTYLGAGKRLHISHSAIHRQIRLLEHQLGVRILIRKGKGVELTEAGKILEDLALRVRSDVDATVRQIGDLEELRSGVLRIGTGTTMLLLFLPAVLERFRAEFAGVSVQLMTATAADVRSELQRGHLDVGVILSGPTQPHAENGLKYEWLYTEEFVPCAGRSHALGRRRVVTLEELALFPLITYSRTSFTRQTVEHLFTTAGLRPNIDMELENDEAIEDMIKVGMGIAFLPKRRATRDGVHHLRIRGHQVLLQVWLVYRGLSYVPRVIREFSRICRAAVEGPAPR